jgi:hypothetical protein
MSFNRSFYFDIQKYITITISNLNSIKSLVLFSTLILLFLPLFNLPSIQNYNYAHASISLGQSIQQSIQQFQNNLQASINKELQSTLEGNISNNYYSDSGCGDNKEGNNNNSISIQSQTNNNGKTSSTVLNLCGNNTNFFSSSSTPFTTIITTGNENLKGKIVSSEYNLTTGDIINSIFGNWSLVTTTDKGGEIRFNSSFIKQPLFLNSTITINSDLPNRHSSDNTNLITSYGLSNFRTNSIQQINFDKTYHGKIDILKETIMSADTGRIVNSSTFNDVGVSISVFDDQMLTIQFDNQSKLSKEFENIPLVGIVQ